MNEVAPPVHEFFAEDRAKATAGGAQVILQTKIDALDITILKGGGADVDEYA